MQKYSYLIGPFENLARWRLRFQLATVRLHISFYWIYIWDVCMLSCFLRCKYWKNYLGRLISQNFHNNLRFWKLKNRFNSRRLIWIRYYRTYLSQLIWANFSHLCIRYSCSDRQYCCIFLDYENQDLKRRPNWKY